MARRDAERHAMQLSDDLFRAVSGKTRMELARTQTRLDKDGVYDPDFAKTDLLNIALDQWIDEVADRCKSAGLKKPTKAACRRWSIERDVWIRLEKAQECTGLDKSQLVRACLFMLATERRKTPRNQYRLFKNRARGRA